MNDSSSRDTACLKSAAQLSRSRIVDGFQVEDSRFLIVSCQDIPEQHQHIRTIVFDDSACCAVVDRLEIGKKHYLVVEAQIDFVHNYSNLSELLTDRELQIVAFVALGWSNKQIAKRLEISEWTVSTHLRRTFIKLNVDSRAAMVYRCAPLIQGILQEQAVY